MAQVMAKKGDHQRAPEADEPTCKHADGTMVHFKMVGPVARVGRAKDTEASHTKNRGRCLQQWRHGLMTAAKPKAGTAHASAPGNADAAGSRGERFDYAASKEDTDGPIGGRNHPVGI